MSEQRASEYKVNNTHRSTVFLYSGDKPNKNEIRKRIPFTVVSKKVNTYGST